MTQQLTVRYPAEMAGSAQKQKSITRKVQPQQQKISAAALAAQVGMEFPSNGLSVIIDDQEGPVAVHAGGSGEHRK